MSLRIQRDVDSREFLQVLRRHERPAYLPFYEHIASPGFMADCMGLSLRELPEYGAPEYWRLYVDFWLGMGWDHIPTEIPPRMRLENPTFCIRAAIWRKSIPT